MHVHILYECRCYVRNMDEPEPTPNNKNKVILLIVTGASRGFGRASALAFCQRRHPSDGRHIVAVLVGRSAVGLAETEEQLRRISSEWNDDSIRQRVVSRVVVANLGDLDTLDHTIDRILAQAEDDRFDECVLINNAGSLGHIGPAMSAPSLIDLRQTVNLNITAALWLSVRIMQWARQQSSCSGFSLKKCAIVDVSSLVAIQPFPTLAVYSAGKAARDAYHNSMAQDFAAANDESNNPLAIRILNYAPGPLEGTDMTQQLREADTLHASLKPHYQKTLVDVHDSARALMDLLQSDMFDNGQHVDYYDLVPPAQSNV